METLATGTPVVATQVGGVAEVVEVGKSGFLAPPRDPAALSQAMRQLMDLSTEQRRQMGVTGQAHVAAHYSLQAMAQRWLALYEELMTQKGLSASFGNREQAWDKAKEPLTW
jgi:glycosyltransferase involved in cell wall biosynthesis